MFCKMVKRKSGQCILFPLLSVVVILCAVILCLATLFHTRPQNSQVERFDQLQFPTFDSLTCPVCKPCSPVTSVNHRDNTVSDIGNRGSVHPAIIDTDFINCSIPFWSDVSCLKMRGEVYMPASFIRTFFEVYGQIKEDKGYISYQFQYSYGNLFKLQNPYYPGGVFNNFDHYNVEQRSKVLCVTATDGIPLTTQWRADGYYYTITVAQYGLSHHAKALTQGCPQPWILTDGFRLFGDWVYQDEEFIMETRNIDIGGSQHQDVMHFSVLSRHGQKGPTIKFPRTKNSSLCFDVSLNGTGEIIVTIMKKDRSLGYVHFDHRNMVWDTKRDGHVYYGMGLETPLKWIRLVRDIAIDWNRAFSRSSIRSPTAFDRIVSIVFLGSGFLDNFTIAASHHMEHLIKAADWLVSNQDDNGGWPTEFAIKTGPIHLDPGWYSAMGQGQAMSTLVRAYNITGRSHYLQIAEKALRLFTISSNNGGVKTQFMNNLDWYEEYPTTPYGTFVLNGFVFSLLGLYDVMETVKDKSQILAKTLWESGLKSLKMMLGMFDSGTGTFYDLRHVVYHDQPNRARWDYHMVHIQLIQQLAIIDGDPLFNVTASRWIQYSQGKRAKHN